MSICKIWGGAVHFWFMAYCVSSRIKRLADKYGILPIFIAPVLSWNTCNIRIFVLCFLLFGILTFIWLFILENGTLCQGTEKN